VSKLNLLISESIGVNPKSRSKPLLCMEINPPRGINYSSTLEQLGKRAEQLDFVNVTDCALAKMRASSISFAAIIKNKTGIEPLVNISCRDRNVMALQADLLGAQLLGLSSVITLTGDAMSVGYTPEAKGVFEVNSVGLLEIISNLNLAKDGTGRELRGNTQIVAGVVANPNANNMSAELKRLKKKKDAGAVYVLTQPVYDFNKAQEFCSQATQLGLAVFLGLMPIKDKSALGSIAKIPGIKIAEEIFSQWQTLDDQDLKKASFEFCLQQARTCLDNVVGFHIVAGASVKLAFELLDLMSSWKKEL